jgi:hypothetical protein
MCTQRPCKEVTLARIADHAAFTRHLYGVREKHAFIEDPHSPDCQHCGMPNDPGSHLERRGEFDDPKLPDTSPWQEGQLLAGESGEPFKVTRTRYDGLVFTPLGPIGPPQANPPKGAAPLVRAS